MAREKMTEAEKKKKAAEKKRAAEERKAKLANMSDADKKEFRKQEKSANFVKLAKNRMTKALASIKVLGNLGNRNQYTYTEEQVQKMRGALVEALNDTMRRFAPKAEGEEAESGFSF